MRKTKIICTLGPATDKGDIVRQMILAGMNVARMNFSHGNHEEHKERMDMVKKLRDELKMPVGIMLDTKGPEIRIKTFIEGKIDLVTDQLFTLTTRDVEGTNEIVSITYMGLPTDSTIGTRILIDDGLVELIAEEIKGQDIICRVKNNGKLSNRKSVNVPGIKLQMEYISEKDKSDILFGLGQGINFIAASFARTRQDMLDIKAIMKESGVSDVGIIAKIENMEGVINLDEILDEVDGIMVARGDMGVEVSFEELPRIQKQIIKKCISKGKRVITATQMLESMQTNPRATRAEVSDVANAVYDGTSAIMLSGETANGAYPVLAVQTMATIAQKTEENIHYTKRRVTREEFTDLDTVGDNITGAIAHATCTTAQDLSCKTIVAFTDSGVTAKAVSSYRPGITIVSPTPNERTYNGLTMSWGVLPVLVECRPRNESELFEISAKVAKDVGIAKAGDLITITAGMPVGVTHTTNTLRIYEIK